MQIKGLAITPTKMVDSRNAANMKFDNVTVSANMLIGEEDNAFDLINSVLDISRAAISVEMLGSALLHMKSIWITQRKRTIRV